MKALLKPEKSAENFPTFRKNPWLFCFWLLFLISFVLPAVNTAKGWQCFQIALSDCRYVSVLSFPFCASGVLNFTTFLAPLVTGKVQKIFLYAVAAHFLNSLLLLFLTLGSGQYSSFTIGYFVWIISQAGIAATIFMENEMKR